MVVKFGGYIAMRVFTLNSIMDDPYHAREIGLSGEERNKIVGLVKEMDEIVSCRSERKGEPILGPHVAISGYDEVIETISNPSKAGGILEQIFDIMKKYKIDSQFYHSLGEAFADAGLKPKPETKRAIDYGTEMHEKYIRYLSGSHYSLKDIEHDISWIVDEKKIGKN